MLSIYDEEIYKRKPLPLGSKGFLSVSTLLCVDIASWAGKTFLSQHIPPYP